jgi:hypothetical protein
MDQHHEEQRRKREANAVGRIVGILCGVFGSVFGGAFLLRRNRRQQSDTPESTGNELYSAEWVAAQRSEATARDGDPAAAPVATQVRRRSLISQGVSGVLPHRVSLRVPRLASTANCSAFLEARECTDCAAVHGPDDRDAAARYGHGWRADGGEDPKRPNDGSDSASGYTAWWTVHGDDGGLACSTGDGLPRWFSTTLLKVGQRSTIGA